MKNCYTAIKFARWLLKYCTMEFEEKTLSYKYEGKFYTTEKLFIVFQKLNTKK